MRKVLIVTYYFPPSGGPGVQRVLKFAKYLPQLGYEPVILTVDEGDYPAKDESLLKSIPPEIKVIRTKIFEPYGMYRRLTGKKPGSAVDVENIPTGKKRRPAERFAEFIRSTFFVPDARVGWLPFAVSGGMEAVAHDGIDIIYSSSPPYTSALIAGSIKRKSGLPWVMGLRDPWTGFISAPQRWFIPAAIDRRMEHSSVTNADATEVAWEGIGRDLRSKYQDINDNRIVYIPNGFDSEDYPAAPAENKGRFTITYTGSLYGRRNPRTILAAVQKLRAEGKISPENIRLIFAGRFSSEVREMLADPALNGMIDVKEYIPHEESIKLLLMSDLLLLIVDESPLSAEIVPGKVFEYIGARKPIIAFAPEGAASKILRNTGAGFVVAPEDVAGAARLIGSFCGAGGEEYSAKKSGVYAPDEEAIKQFERKEAARKLASLFTKTLERKNGQTA